LKNLGFIDQFFDYDFFDCNFSEKKNKMFRILPTNIKINRRELYSLKNNVMTGVNIFNPDNKRFQIVLRCHSIKNQLIKFLQQNNYLDKRKIGTTVILHSTKNCKKQQWHTDYDPDACQKSKVKPLGVLFALQNNTYLNVYNKGRICLNKGEVLIFDGDLIHAGSAYKCENTRIHMYLDSEEFKRVRNKTYILNN
tara:strand:- start:358 stop:942 length:585 start_codon:yes stop_codon:yes gene_type:complete